MGRSSRYFIVFSKQVFRNTFVGLLMICTGIFFFSNKHKHNDEPRKQLTRRALQKAINYYCKALYLRCLRGPCYASGEQKQILTSFYKRASQKNVTKFTAKDFFCQSLMSIKLQVYSWKVTPFRSSRSQMFFEIGALKNFAIFTGKHLC